MKKKFIYRLVLVSFTYLAFQSVSMADGSSNTGEKSQCDVVHISGTGNLQIDGSIIGNEILTVVATGESTALSFEAVTLGALAIDPDSASVTLAASHDFTSIKSGKVNFTTFDEITIIPLGGSDANCTTNACGLLFKLKLEKGRGRYNCGEIVSGYNTDPNALIPFTSFINPSNPAPNGDAITFNSMGKLCKCGGDD